MKLVYRFLARLGGGNYPLRLGDFDQPIPCAEEK